MKADFKKRLQILMQNDKPYTWARKVGIDKGLFQYYWQKGRIPTYENLLKIQRYTGCSLDWLLTGREIDVSSAKAVQDKCNGNNKKPAIGERKSKTVRKVRVLYASGNSRDIDILESFLEKLVPEKDLPGL